MSTCKRDVVVRDETETFGFQSETRPRPRPSHTLPRPRRLKNTSRDRLETETSRPRLQLCSLAWIFLDLGSSSGLYYLAVCQVFVFVFLVLAVSGGTHEGDYLSLPFAWHIRLIVFTCIVSLLVCIFVIGLHLTSTASMFPVDWQLFVSLISVSWVISASTAAVTTLWVKKNQAIIFVSMTLPNINQFLKFFHWHTHREICNKSDN